MELSQKLRWAGKKSGPSPVDRAKGGVKRSLLTEASGIPVGLVIAGANRHDMKLVQETLESIPATIEERRKEHLETQECEQGLCMDAGYDYDEVREIAQAFGYTTHIRPRGEEKKALEAGKKARRWVVERTHSWLNRYRRLLIRWEKKAHNYLALLHFACALITWKFCLFG
jgi:putative transposase